MSERDALIAILVVSMADWDKSAERVSAVLKRLGWSIDDLGAFLDEVAKLTEEMGIKKGAFTVQYDDEVRKSVRSEDDETLEISAISIRTNQKITARKLKLIEEEQARRSLVDDRSD